MSQSNTPKSNVSSNISTAKLTSFKATTLDATLVFGMALLTALLAQVKVPLPYTPVPMTLQTLAVVGSGAFLGLRRGTLSQVLYLVLGGLGAPFFAGTAGAAALFGPTGGYLFGFVLSALTAALLMTLPAVKRSYTLTWSALFLASLPCLGLGVLWLKLWLHLSFNQAILLGLTPFILGDLLKTTVLALLVKKFKS